MLGLGWLADPRIRPDFGSQQLTLVPWGIEKILDELKRYLETGTPMSEVPWDLLDQSEWSDFQRQVYQATTKIPHGQTRTYGWVANRVQKPSAGRAVGQALRHNPVAILIPCHRVVSTSTLGGFMGCGSDAGEDTPELKLKKKLLSLEEEFLNPIFPFLLGGGDSQGLAFDLGVGASAWATG